MSALTILVLTLSIISTLSFQPANKDALVTALQAGCTNGWTHNAMVYTPISDWDTSLITDMNNLIGSLTCRGTFNQPLSNWNVSQVTDMSNMFYYAQDFNQPIGNWDVSKVTDMSNMFHYAQSFNQPIGNWNVSQVTDMSNMFYYAQDFNQPIGTWNVSQVTDMSSMFSYARAFNQPISNWDVSQVTTMYFMFRYSWSFNQPLGNWDVGRVTAADGCRGMFANAYSLTYDMSTLEAKFISGCTAFTANTRAGSGQCADRTALSATDIKIQDGLVHTDVVQCHAGARDGVTEKNCAAEGCIDDNSICCLSPCGTHTTVTACTAGSSVCWWDADESKCQRLCNKPYKFETDRLCSNNAKALHVLSHQC
jgi:surface protein